LQAEAARISSWHDLHGATDGVEKVSAKRPSIPYDQITVLVWNGFRITRQPIVDKFTFDGYHINWRRSSALSASGVLRSRKRWSAPVRRSDYGLRASPSRSPE